MIAELSNKEKGCGLFLLIAIPLLVVIYFVFVMIENLRGAKAWKRSVANFEAVEETVEMETFLAKLPKIEEEENFAAIPLLDSLVDFSYQESPEGGRNSGWKKGAPIYNKKEERERFLKLTLPDLTGEKPPPRASAWKRAEPVDLAAWHSTLRKEGSLNLSGGNKHAKKVLSALNAHVREIIDELAEATNRPHAQFKVYQALDSFKDTISFSVPHCNECTKAVKLLNLHASAAIAQGDGQAALRSILVALRLAEANGSSFHLIGVLVEITGYSIITSAIWEGLRAEIWDHEQLEKLESFLTRPDLLAAGYRAMQGETALYTGSFLTFAKHASRKELKSLISTSENLGYPADIKSSALIYLFPRGWIDQNCALTAEIQLKYNLIPLRDRDVNSLLGQESPVAELSKTTPYNILANMFMPVYSGIHERYLITDSLIAMIRNACRLEQHKLRTGSYPNDLNTLSEKLPKDLLSDALFHYARTDDGRYKLWSIGINQQNDGGRVALKDNGNKTDDTQGDLVWAYRPEDLMPEVE